MAVHPPPAGGRARAGRPLRDLGRHVRPVGTSFLAGGKPEAIGCSFVWPLSRTPFPISTHVFAHRLDHHPNNQTTSPPSLPETVLHTTFPNLDTSTTPTQPFFFSRTDPHRRLSLPSRNCTCRSPYTSAHQLSPFPSTTYASPLLSVVIAQASPTRHGSLVACAPSPWSIAAFILSNSEMPSSRPRCVLRPLLRPASLYRVAVAPPPLA